MTSLDQCGPAREQGYSAADHTQVNVTLEPVEDLAGEALVEFAPVEADSRAGRCLRRGPRLRGRREALLGLCAASGGDGVEVGVIAASDDLVEPVEFAQVADRRGIRVACVADSRVDPTPLAARLRRDLRMAGLAQPDVSIAMVQAIPRDPRTGKVKRFLPSQP
jgi:hypothetical protein